MNNLVNLDQFAIEEYQDTVSFLDSKQKDWFKRECEKPAVDYLKRKNRSKMVLNNQFRPKTNMSWSNNKECVSRDFTHDCH